MEAVGVENKWDVYWALAACFVRRREELVLFDEVFDLFFRDPFAMSKALGALVSRSSIPDARNRPDPGSRRAREALQKPKPPPPLDPDAPREKRIEYDVTMTASAEHTLRARDFEKMTAAEVARAREAIQRMPLPRATVKTRRLQPDARGAKLDFRRTLAATLRSGGDTIVLRRRGPRERPPPLVAICDISGSMERYSRMVLHFLHALSRSRPKVSSFVFGTRLTNVTRWLRERDVDEALAAVGREVTDWSGGTRIGESLRTFNKVWSRRVLGQGAVVLLITDGLERGDAAAAGARGRAAPEVVPPPHLAEPAAPLRRLRTARRRRESDAGPRGRASHRAPSEQPRGAGAHPRRRSSEAPDVVTRGVSGA